MIATLVILAYYNVVTIFGGDPDPIVDFLDGDILIGYVDTVTGRSRVQNMLAFQAAMTDTALIKPKNATVGYVVYSQMENIEMVTKLNTMLLTYPKLVAVVGFRRSLIDAIQATSFVSAIKLPCFTYANAIQLDELLKLKNMDYMTRITSTKSRQIAGTIPGILKTLGVNIVSIIYGLGKEMEFCELTKVLDFGKDKVDVEFSSFLNKTDESKDALKKYLWDKKKDRSDKEQRIHTIVMLLQKTDFNSLIEEFANLEADNPLTDTVIVTDSSACKISSVTTLRNLVKGNNVFLFRLCQTYYMDQQVMDFIDGYELYKRSEGGNIHSNSKVLDSWYREYVGEPCITEEAGDCESVASASMISISDFSRYNARIYYTVRKIVRSLENITKEQATEVANRNFKSIVIEGSSVGDMIRRGFLANNVQLPENTTFLRYSNGVMDDDYEVMFDTEDLSETTVWTSGTNNNAFLKFMEVAKSEIINRTGGYFICSFECSPGSRTVFDRKYINCWTCVLCVGNTYTSNGSWTSCKECDSNVTYLWANENRTTCDQPSGSVNLSTTSGKVIWVIVCINICILIFTVGIYIKHWKSRVIISSGRDLSCAIFVGILAGHIEAMFIAMEPSIQICTTIHILGHVFMMLTVCPLLVKTFRIWLVFKFSIKFGRKIKDYIATWITMSECAVLMLPQLSFLVLGLFMDDSYGFNFVTNYVEESLETPIVVTKSCGPKSFTLMLISIIYTGVLLLASTLLGWDCRKLPDNFKESMHIFLSSLMSLLLVTVYVPAMLTMAGFTQVSLLGGVISIISVTLNLVIFIPKVYVVLLVSPIQQKQMFKRTHSRTRTSRLTIDQSEAPVTMDGEIELSP